MENEDVKQKSPASPPAPKPGVFLSFLNKLKTLSIEYLAVGAGFIVLFAFAYYHFFINMNRFVSISMPGESFLSYWVWREWMSGYLLDLFWNQKPFSLINFIYYGVLSNGSVPETGNLTDVLLISLPLRSLFKFPLYHNLRFVIIVLFNGFAGYYAVKGITKRFFPAFIAGAFMVINPYSIMILNKARLRAAILGFIILYIYHLYKFSQKPTMKEAVPCGIFLGLASIFYWFHGVFLALITIIFYLGKVLYDLIKGKKSEAIHFTTGLLLTFLITGLIAAPWLLPYRTLLARNENMRAQGIVLKDTIPTPDVVLSNDFMRGGDRTRETLRLVVIESLPLGLFVSPLFLLLIPGAFFQKKKFALFLLAVFILFSILSMGPWLKTADHSDLRAFAKTDDNGFLALPYHLFYKYVPLASRLHHPDHIFGVAVTALMFLGGLGLNELFRRFDSKKTVSLILFTVIIFTLAFSLNLCHPRTRVILKDVQIPAFYNKLARQPYCRIFELPMPVNDFMLGRIYEKYDFYQSIHNKKVTSSHFEGVLFNSLNVKVDDVYFQNSWERIKNNKFAEYLSTAHKGASPDFAEEDVKEMRDLGYRYIVIHKVDFIRYHNFDLRDDTEKSAESYYRTRGYLDESPLFERLDEGFEYKEPYYYPGKDLKKFETLIYRIK